MNSNFFIPRVPLRAAIVAGGLTACASAALEVAGPLLIDLDATDYNTADGVWPQHSPTGIPGSFSKLPTGTPQLQTVAGRQALVLDGEGDSLTGPVTTAALDGPNAPHSVEYWVFQGQARPEESVISWSGRGGPEGTYAGFRYGSSGTAGAVGRWGAPDMGFAAPLAGGPAVGVWHHIVVTYDGTDQCIYVDGQLNSIEAANLDSKDGLPIYIGSEHDPNGTDSGRVRQFSGAISRIRVHGGALTGSQVLNNYNLEAPEHPGTTPADLSHPPLHRWSFNDPEGDAVEGTLVTDSIGGLTGVIKGSGALFTGSEIALPGGLPATLPAYVDLPNGLVSSKKRLTLEIWARQASTQSGSRVMSFSRSTLGEINTAGNTPGFNGVESISLYANTGTATNMKLERNGGTFPNGAGFRQSEGATTFNTLMHYVITYDTDFREWRLYRNGSLMETLPETQGPTSVGDVNNWLGRSDFGADSGFAGWIDEFRVYNYTLSESEIYGNTLAGPDTLTSGSTTVHRWTPLAGGTYAFNNAGGQNNWDPVGTFPDAAGASAVMTANLSGDQTVNLNTTVSLGNLTLGDEDGSNRFKLAAGTGGILEMSAAPGLDASLTQSSTSGPNEISAPLLLGSDTELANTSATAVLTLSGTLSGAGNFSKAGTGKVILTADNSSYGGTITVNSGQLVIGDGGLTGTLGGGPVVLTDEGILTLNRQDATNFDKPVSGAGTIRLTGAGKVTNTGNLTTNGPLQIYPGASLATQMPVTVASANIDGGLVLDKPLAFTTNGDFVVGDTQPGAANVTVSDGTVDAATIVIGKNTGTSGVILQTGGTVNDRTGGTDCYIGGGNNAAFGVWGAYRMTGGVLNTTNHFQVGAQGIGILEVENATVNFTAGVPSIGRFQNGTNSRGRGLLDIRTGAVINQLAPGSRMTIGEKGTGVLNVRDGGTAVLTGGLLVSAGGANDSGDGTVNLLTGGIIETQIVAKGGGAREALFNFNGGTLRARGDQPGTNQTTFMTGCTAYVYGGGAVIDTNGFNLRTTQIFRDPTGRGVATIPVTNGGSGYLAPPYVEIVGNGKGATAIANLTGDHVTSITITNPGTDYTSPPAVNILGGGAGTGLSLGTPTLAPNIPGNIEKTGAGSLSLEGASFHTGATLVKGGTLLLNADHINAPGGTHVSGGATLGGTGIVGGDVVAAGSINPGGRTTADAAGLLTVMGSASFETGGSLVIDIDGATERKCDTLNVGGNLNLDGAALTMNLAGAVPQLPLTIATFAGRTGEFASLPAGVTVAYKPTSIEITAIDTATGDAFSDWIEGYFPGQTNPLVTGTDADPDGDGSTNLQEYALGGLPNSGSSHPKMFVLQTERPQGGTSKDTVMTIAVLEGTPAFANGSPPKASFSGFDYTVQGSADLIDFGYPVSAIAPVTTNLGSPPAGYEFRSFKLDDPTNDLSRGFLRVKVTPTP